MPDEQLTTEIYEINPRELTLLTKNARRMSQRQFKQLVDNIQRDGVLTSMPLVHKQEDGKLLVLSGNHRTKAAIAAGLRSIPVLEVKGEHLDAERLLAIQLSHNAINGEDDENILRELYDSLDVAAKLYSGLTDADFGGVADLDLSKLAIAAPRYETVQLMFLPDDREIFIEAMERLGKAVPKAKRYIGRLSDYEQFDKALVAVQDTLNIHNQALALAAMSELALERLEQLEGGNADTEQSSIRTDATTAGSTDETGSGDGPPKQRRNPSDRGRKAKGQPTDDLPDGSEAS